MIACRVRRELTMRAPAAPGRPSHLAAASGLVRIGDRLYVVADDELAIGVFPADGDAPGAWIAALPGELPLEPRARKKRKPDLEALVALPDGALFLLPSASRANRVTGALVAPGGDTRAVDCSAWLLPLRERVPALNLEGAVFVGAELRLFHRGAPNLCLRFDGAAIAEDIRRGAVAVHAPSRVDEIALPAIGGVALGISDACALDDGRVVFCAVAEDTDDPYEDGAFKGAAIGVLDPAGALARLERIAAPAKIEGIDARVNGAGIDLLLVTDADDAARAALLIEARFDATPKS